MKVFGFADEASALITGQISAMHRNKLDGLEIRNVNNENIAEITLQTARKIRKQLDDEGLSVWSIGSPIGKIDICESDFEAHLEKFRHVLEIADVLSAENIRLFSFYMPKNNLVSDYREEVIERLGRLCELAYGSNITLCHENEKGIYGDTADRCLDLFTALPQLKGIFDPANFVQCGIDTQEAWDLLAPHIKYLHIKDALADGHIVPAGFGIGKIEAILLDFKKRGGAAVTIEPHLAVFSGLSDLEREGEGSLIGKYHYDDNDTAFNAACDAFWKLMEKGGAFV